MLPVTGSDHEVNSWVGWGFPILSWGVLFASFIMFKHTFNLTGFINVNEMHIM